jgi:hypothetical protein
VTLSDDERTLYDLAFRSLRPREFVSLALLGEWKTAAAGDKVLMKGQAVSSRRRQTVKQKWLSDGGHWLA